MIEAGGYPFFRKEEINPFPDESLHNILTGLLP
jgi:hypothetical protein